METSYKENTATAPISLRINYELLCHFNFPSRFYFKPVEFFDINRSLSKNESEETCFGPVHHFIDQDIVSLRINSYKPK